jgi:hypothetical protein
VKDLSWLCQGSEGKALHAITHLKEEGNIMISLATPDGKGLDAIQSLEKKIGKTILAFNQWQPDDLSEDEVKLLQDLEKDTCFTLVAIKKD